MNFFCEGIIQQSVHCLDIERILLLFKSQENISVQFKIFCLLQNSKEISHNKVCVMGDTQSTLLLLASK